MTIKSKVAAVPATAPSSKPGNDQKQEASHMPGPSKLDQLVALLARADGASLAEMMAVTGWQQHSVRGAIAGALKKRGLVITSDKVDGIRRYRTAASQ